MKLRPKRQPLSSDPVVALHAAYGLLHHSNGKEALRILFRVARSPEPPQKWRKALTSLAKQVRRVLAFDEKAKRAAESGNFAEAERQLGLAEKVLAEAPVGLVVKQSGPRLEASEDLAQTVLRGAETMLYTSRLGLSQQRRAEAKSAHRPTIG